MNKCYRYCFLFIFALIITSCFRLNSEKKPILVIENGIYHNTDSSCTISFDYYVTHKRCQVGGWGIDWQTGSKGTTNWYSLQTLIPDERYAIQQTFYHNTSLPPIITMYGYPLHDNDAFTILEACDTLHNIIY
jgi:hypothetical protein